MWALKPTSNRGSHAPRGDGRRVDSDRQLQAFRRGMDSHAPRETPLPATPGRGDDAWPRARVFAIQVYACSRRAQERSNRPRCLGVRLNRALRATMGNALRHALGAKRKMCRVAQTRYINIRLPKSHVNPQHAFCLRWSEAIRTRHRASAHDVPRASAVNARRPRRTGGVEA